MHNLFDDTTWIKWNDNKCETWPGNVFPEVLNEQCEEVLDVYRRNTEFLNVYDIYWEEHDDTELITYGEAFLNGEMKKYQWGFTV